MKAKIKRVEEGIVVVADQQWFAGFADGAEVEISADGDALVLTPVHRAELRKVLDEMDEQYASVFRRLAE